MTNQQNTKSPQVLIVGAGPVGLCLAHFLHMNSIKFRIIEKRTTIDFYSRAFAIHSRSLEILNLIGVVEEMVDTGRKLENLEAVIYRHGKLIMDLKLPKPNSSQPFITGLVQSETEKILETKLNKLGYKVERGIELVNVEFVDKVAKAATVKNLTDNSDERIEFQYIVGCDGARSIVRKQADIKFDGETVNLNLLCCDVKLDTDLPTINFGNIFFEEEFGGGIINIKGDIVRLILQLKDGEEEPTETQVFAKFKKLVLPYKFEVKETIWINIFKINERTASTHIQKNVILCGDAAHVHSPAGGQGMNTGIQDAFNLAWKLTLQLKGLTKSNTLLETFNSERKDIAKLVLANSGAAIRALSRKPSLITTLQRFYLLPLAFSFDAIKILASDSLSEVVLEYDENVVNVKYKCCNFSKALVKGVGLRIPSYHLLDLNSKDVVNTHHFFNGTSKFQLLVFVPHQIINLIYLPYLYNTFSQLNQAKNLIELVDIRIVVPNQMFDWKIWVQSQLLLQPNLAVVDQNKLKDLIVAIDKFNIYLDQTAETTNYFQLPKDEISFVVIRPDFHICNIFSCDAKVNGLIDYFNTFLKV